MLINSPPGQMGAGGKQVVRRSRWDFSFTHYLARWPWMNLEYLNYTVKLLSNT